MKGKGLLILSALFLLAGCSSKPSQAYSFKVNEFEDYVTPIELTIDNWNDYFRIKKVHGNAYLENGEIDPQYTQTGFIVVAKNNRLIVVDEDTQLDFGYSYFEQIVSKYIAGKYPDIKHDAILERNSAIVRLDKLPTSIYINAIYQENEQLTCMDEASGDFFKCEMITDKQVDSFDCIKASGKIYVLDIPEDKWMLDENNNQYVAICDSKHRTVTRYYQAGYREVYDFKGNLISHTKDIIEYHQNLPTKDFILDSQLPIVGWQLTEILN